MIEKEDLSPNDWDSHTRRFRESPGGLWRSYCDLLHLQLIDEWLPKLGQRILKTDLFDEAIGDGVLGRIGFESVKFGVDISQGVVRDAWRRQESIQALVGDLRSLPLTNESMNTVISNSSLDHFATKNEITLSLRELHRLLRVDGKLLITLDNPMCPVIALRRLLPYRFLNRLGLVPYPVGATMTLRRLITELEKIGFTIERRGVIMHIPRFLSIPVCRKKDRVNRDSSDRFIARMLKFEKLRRLPTSQFTGHFVAVLAVKS